MLAVQQGQHVGSIVSEFWNTSIMRHKLNLPTSLRFLFRRHYNTKRKMSEKLKRRENFSQEEKEIIINYVKKNGTILEDKSGNAKMHIAKKQKWKELEEELKALGSTRT
ncbi:hypothetical protein RF55_15392 [Lasius niger]|uniref:Regulatory protein zeste n=1 Tax=Lasius niger TaxID=67767 RepID=A0A0J7K6F4_LASNI|nr:hypothetical protein RF55_15392 [Lasius niger]